MKKIYLFFIGMLLLVYGNMSKVAAESTIYLFQNFPYLSTWHYDVTFNGDTISLPQTEMLNPNSNGLKKYPKAVHKCNIKNDGRLIITKEYSWYQKPYHDEIILDLVDGETYFIEYMSGFSNNFKLLDSKKGEKLLQKAGKDNKNWVVFENAIDYEN